MIQKYIFGIVKYTLKSRFILYVIVYTIFYLVKCVSKPEIYYNGDKRNNLKKMKSLFKYYFPFFIAPFGELQSFLQIHRKVKISGKISVKIETILNGIIGLDVYDPKRLPKNILLVHGFNGSGDSSYIKGLAYHLIKAGYRVFCFNARGTKIKLKNEFFFHIGWTEDINVAVDYILKNYTGTLELYGFSLGAGWVTKYLGEKNRSPRIIKGGAVCLPLDFHKLNSHFQKNTYTRFWNRIMTKNFVRFMNKNPEIFKKAGYDLAVVEKCKNMHEVDVIVTSKIFKLKSVEEYYKTQSCLNFVHGINVPFLILNTYDDPFVPFFSFDKELCIKNKNILFVMCHRGGHLGFLTNSYGKTFAEEVIIDFVKHF